MLKKRQASGLGRVRFRTLPFPLCFILFMGLPPLRTMVNIWGTNLKGEKVSLAHTDPNYSFKVLTHIDFVLKGLPPHAIEIQ